MNKNTAQIKLWTSGVAVEQSRPGAWETQRAKEDEIQVVITFASHSANYKHRDTEQAIFQERQFNF